MKNLPKFLFLLLVSALVYESFAQNWTQQTSNTTQNLSGVSFVNQNLGFVCGDTGTVLKTIDGGINWVPQNSGTTKQLAGLQFIDANIGYATSWMDDGGVLFKTVDGGISWTDISLNIPNTHSGGGWFFSADTGLMALGDNSFANSIILKTVNGGISWDTVYTGGTGWLSFIHFPDNMNGYATVSGSGVLKTTDGGNSWTLLNNIGGNLWMSGVYFFNKDTGLVSGGDFNTGGGSIFKTTNGGSTWQTLTNNYYTSIMLFNTPDIGYAIGGDSSGKKIIKTMDGGVSWAYDALPTDSTLNGISFPSSDIGYAVGNGGTIIKYFIPKNIYGNLWNQDMTSGISNGKVYLIEYDTAAVQLTYVDSVTLSGGMNEYFFFGHPSGNYLILVHPDTAIYPNTIPTYYGDTAYWGYAEVLQLISDTFNVDIRVRQTLVWTGTGFCSGTIQYGIGSGKTGGGNVIPFGDPVPGIDVFLEQIPGGIKANSTTDNTGFYSFLNIPMNTTYRLLVDIPGLPMDSSYTISINSSDSVVTDLDYVVDTASDGSAGIYIGYPLSANEIGIKDLGFRIYPNPNDGKFQLSVFGSQYSVKEVKVYNVLGEVIYKYESLNTEYRIPNTIDISSQPKGIFFIHAKTERGMWIGKVAIE